MVARRVDLVLFALLTLITSYGGSLPSARAQQIHLILACEPNDPEIRESMKLSSDKIKLVFQNNLPEKMLTVTEVPANRFTGNELLDTVGEPQLQPEDVLVYFYCGHGSYDRGDDETHLTPREGKPVWQVTWLAGVPRACLPAITSNTVFAATCCTAFSTSSTGTLTVFC